MANGKMGCCGVILPQYIITLAVYAKSLAKIQAARPPRFSAQVSRVNQFDP